MLPNYSVHKYYIGHFLSLLTFCFYIMLSDLVCAYFLFVFLYVSLYLCINERMGIVVDDQRGVRGGETIQNIKIKLKKYQIKGICIRNF